MKDYPTDRQLKMIRYWDSTIEELYDFIVELWEYEPPSMRNGFNSLRKYVYKMEIHTWGWSGNEDIVEELKHTMFWIVCWQKSTRGGHYYFEIPRWALTDLKCDWGDPRKVNRK
mgnify:FL=1